MKCKLCGKPAIIEIDMPNGRQPVCSECLAELIAESYGEELAGEEDPYKEIDKKYIQ